MSLESKLVFQLNKTHLMNLILTLRLVTLLFIRKKILNNKNKGRLPQNTLGRDIRI